MYKLSYLTQAGWPHVYIGYTGDADWRKVWHKVKPNAWNQYRAEDSELAWVELEQTHDKSVALALEAFHAARAVAAEPASSRGGPWSRPTLTKAMLQEARLASGMTLAAMFAYARDNPEGGLGRHLKDLSYEPSRKSGARNVARGVAAVRKKKIRPIGLLRQRLSQEPGRGEDIEKNVGLFRAASWVAVRGLVPNLITQSKFPKTVFIPICEKMTLHCVDSGVF